MRVLIDVPHWLVSVLAVAVTAGALWASRQGARP